MQKVFEVQIYPWEGMGYKVFLHYKTYCTSSKKWSRWQVRAQTFKPTVDQGKEWAKEQKSQALREPEGVIEYQI